MADLVLATLNATYAHASLGLRCLLANLGELAPRASLREFTLVERPVDIAEQLLAEQPRLVGLGVYVWNARPMLELVRLLKRLRPDLCIVLGGPEVSYEVEAQPIVGLADYIVCGEGELAFRDLATRLLSGERPKERVLQASPPDLAVIALPYDGYSAVDLAERVVYLETSRGCPYGCHFCLSALDRRVREFPLPAMLAALADLWARGLRRFRFVDRTFNIDLARARAVLDFFAARQTPDTFVHVEMVAERVAPELLSSLSRFAPGTVQLEVGVQSFAPEVCATIERASDAARVEQGLRDLGATGAHVHADLVAGLPGESLASFAAGFDRLVALAPNEIQVGILKRLHGALIARHSETFGMLYSDEPPYEILANDLLDFATLQRIKRFARYWDVVANSGNFKQSAPLLWQGGSPFACFLAFSDWLFGRTGKTHALGLERMCALVLEYLTDVRGCPADDARASLQRDYVRGGRRPLALLANEGDGESSRGARARAVSQGGLPARQARHHRS